MSPKTQPARKVTLSTTQEDALYLLRAAIESLEADNTKSAIWRAEAAIEYLEKWKDIEEGREA